MLKINSWWNKHSKSHGKLVKSHDFPGFYQHFWMIRPDSMCFSPCFPAETALLPSLAPAPRCSEAPRWSEAPGVPPRVPSPADGRSFNTLNNPFQVWIGMIGMIGGIPDFSKFGKVFSKSPWKFGIIVMCLWSFSVNLCARVLWGAWHSLAHGSQGSKLPGFLHNWAWLVADEELSHVCTVLMRNLYISLSRTENKLSAMSIVRDILISRIITTGFDHVPQKYYA